jgi:hypothetical protein
MADLVPQTRPRSPSGTVPWATRSCRWCSPGREQQISPAARESSPNVNTIKSANTFYRTVTRVLHNGVYKTVSSTLFPALLMMLPVARLYRPTWLICWVGSIRGLIKVPAWHLYGGLRKMMRNWNWVRTATVPAEIQTEHLQVTILQHHLLTNVFSDPFLISISKWLITWTA